MGSAGSLKMGRYMSVLMSLLLAGGQAGAVDAPEARKPASEEQVCRRGKETGSRLRAKRVCHTRAEWDQLDAAASKTLENSRTMSRPSG